MSSSLRKHLSAPGLIKSVYNHFSKLPDPREFSRNGCTYADASNNATTIILKAIEHGVKFGLKERVKLAEVSKVANARSNVEKIRKALHEREINS